MRSYIVKRTVFDSVIFAYLLGVALIYATQTGPNNLPTNTVLFTLSALFMLAGAGFSFALSQFRIPTLGQRIFAPPHLMDVSVGRPWYKKFSAWQFLIAFFVTIEVGVRQTGFSWAELTHPGGFAGAMRLFGGLLTPNLDILQDAILNIIQTIFIAFMATILAIPIAFVLSFVCAKNIMKHPIAFGFYVVLRTSMNVIRSVEALIWAIIFSVWVGIGPFAGMLALMLHSIASLAKQYSEIVEVVSDGPIEGIQSTGANWFQIIWYAIVPQVILPYVAFTIYRWDINVRMATIIGLVGGGGIGTMLIKYQGQAMWQEVGTIILVIAIVVWLMDTASAYLREAFK